MIDRTPDRAHRSTATNVVMLCLLAVLTGCSALRDQGSPANLSTALTVQLKGGIHGGQQPIAGASIYLFAAGTTGYPGQAGANAVSLLTSVAGQTAADADGNYYTQSDSTGAFSITGDYSATCQSGNSLVYLLALGGNPGNGGTPPVGDNSAIALAASLGPCSGTSSSTFINVNEVTTVAAAYALAPYAVVPAHGSAVPNTVVVNGFSTGASTGAGSAYQGLANAFATAGNLASIASGQAYATTPATGSQGTVPKAEIDTLADALAACVNSTGPTSSGCSTLFTATTVGGVAPANTLQALLNVAQNPGQASITNSKTGIFSLVSATSPFQPVLAAAPNDWTVAVNFTDASVSAPFGLAVDVQGNVWVANTKSALTEFSSMGSVLSTPTTGFTGGGLSSPYGIGIDASGNIWVANGGGSDVLSEFTSAGVPVSATGYTNGAVSYIVAPDANGNIWTTGSYRDYLYENLSDGSVPSGTPITNAGGLSYGKSSYGAAVDQLGYVWVSNSASNSISKFKVSPLTAASPAAGYTGGGLTANYGLAIDHYNNVWIANPAISGATLSEFNSSGVAVSSTGYSGGGLSNARYVAVDGSNRIWIANATTTGQISAFTNAGVAITPSTGYQATMSNPRYLAVDGSGDVWVANYGSTTITEFVGVATPVVTPIALGVKNSTLGTMP